MTRPGNAGQTAVEFALTAPLMILGMFGLMQGAYFVYGVNGVANAAREGARAAISSGSTCTATDPNVIAGVNRASQGVTPLTITAASGTGLVGLSAKPAIDWAKKSSPSPSPPASPSPTGNPTASPGANHAAGAYCEITVTWAFTPLGGALGFKAASIASTSRYYYNADQTDGGAAGAATQDAGIPHPAPAG